MESKKVIIIGAGLDHTEELAKILSEEPLHSHVVVSPSQIENDKQELIEKVIEFPKIIDKQYFEQPETRQERRRKDRALKKKHNRKI